MPDIQIPQAEVRRRMRKRVLTVIWGVLILVVLGIVAWFMIPQGPSVSRSDVLTATVHFGDFIVQFRAPGVLRSRDERWITSDVSGTVAAIHVYPGSVVKPDTVLVTLANPQLKTAMVEARARLISTQAHAVSEAAQLSDQMLSLKSAWVTAKAAAKSATMKVKADESLLKERVIARLQMETDHLSAYNARAQTDFIHRRILAFQKNVAAQEGAEQAAIAATQASYAEAVANESALHPHAEMQGLVQTVSVQPGQHVASGEVIARIANAKNLDAVLDVPPDDAGEFADGLPVRILIHTDGRSVVDGKIERISPNVVDGMVPVTVRLTGTLPKGVRPKLAISGMITVTTIPHTLYVERPVGAQPNSRMTVYLLGPSGSTATRIPVRYGIASSNAVQVLSGLQKGARIVVSETRHWASRMRIR